MKDFILFVHEKEKEFFQYVDYLRQHSILEFKKTPVDAGMRKILQQYRDRNGWVGARQVSFIL